jgi:hypothetical protein
MTTPRKPRIRQGIILDLPEDTYHGHKGSVSSTGLKQLLVSPRKFLHEREHPRTTNALEEGAVAHRLVLGKGADYEVLDFADRRTNAYKDAAAEARAAGVIPILVHEYEKGLQIANAVLNHPTAGPLLSQGEAEVSAFAKDPTTKVLRRARADRIHDDGLIVDLKTTAASALPAWWAVGRTSKNYSYHVSTAHYIDTFSLAGRAVRGFVHVFVEKEAPHLVSVIQLDELAIEEGRRKVAHGLEVFRDCTATGLWPDWTDYPDPITRVGLPGLTRIQEEEA